MATKLTFTVEEMVIDEGLGYPNAYAKLCRDPYINQYRNGPPFSFIPYSSLPQEVLRAKDLDEMFPIIDSEAKPSAKPRVYASLLWKQLNHLGNAGFDPAKFRVDPYGNVLYYYADSASPLAWEIDHWFPCSRGGRTVPSNLRLLQWQVCKKKQNKLEFLVPWWDLQLGISVNQFLSVFASSNSDFRNRAFSLLFYDGENEELNSKQTVESHTFPSHFLETEQKVGLAPAAIVSCRKESSDASSVLRSIDVNRRLRSSSPVTGSRKYLNDENQSSGKSVQIFRPSLSKENDNTNVGTNPPYSTIAMARDSLRQKEEMQAEIQRLDDELVELKQKNEVERVALQDLELVLIKRRRRAEKSRRLAEAQASYKSLLEKMIRDAMHQSVVYKEQARLNQAAASALMARLEAQKAICDSSEKDLHRKFKQRDEIENQIRPHWARKRSRIDDALFEDREDKGVLYLPGIKTVKLQKELREFLAEEQKASEAGLSPIEEREGTQNDGLVVQFFSENPQEHNKSLIVLEHETPIEDMLQKLEIEEEKKVRSTVSSSVFQSPAREEEEEDEECRNQRGKGNVEKWLQMLLDDDNKEGVSHQNINEDERNNEIMKRLNLQYTQKDIKIPKFPTIEEKTVPKQESEKIESEIVEERDEEVVVVERKDDKLVYDRNNTSEEVCSSSSIRRGGIGRRSGRKSFDVKVRKEKNGNERGGGLVRCESARAFRPIPYSPSTILRMKKGVDCIGKKPVVIGSDEDDDDNENNVVGNNIIKSTTFKKAVKI